MKNTRSYFEKKKGKHKVGPARKGPGYLHLEEEDKLMITERYDWSLIKTYRKAGSSLCRPTLPRASEVSEGTFRALLDRSGSAFVLAWRRQGTQV
jgi:hypothetical protein